MDARYNHSRAEHGTAFTRDTRQTQPHSLYNRATLRRDIVLTPFLFLAFVLPLWARELVFSSSDSGVSATLNSVAYDGTSTFLVSGTSSTVLISSLGTNTWAVTT